SSPTAPALEWDAHLTRSNDYKKMMRTTEGIRRDILEDLLLRQHPRFVWRAVMKLGETKIMELLFDGTGIPRTFSIISVIWYREDFALALKRILDAPQLQPTLIAILTERFLAFLKESIERQSPQPTPP